MAKRKPAAPKGAAETKDKPRKGPRPEAPEPPPPPPPAPEPEPAAAAARPPPAPEPGGRPSPGSRPSPPPPSPLATEAEVLELVARVYPRGLDPASVAYYVSEPWRANLARRAEAEAGARFFEGLVDAIEAETGLDVLERAALVDRPAFVLKVLLHRGKRFKEPVLTDAFLDSLGGEARLLDLWVSALGPYFYAKGYRVIPSFKMDLEGPPPPLAKDDPVARDAMNAAARTLKRMGYRRVPGELARKRLPGVRVPGSLPGEDASVFELLFEGAPVQPAREAPREVRERKVRPTGEGREGAPAGDPETEARIRQGEVDVDMELFQAELEAELDDLKNKIDEAEALREGGAYRAARRGGRP